MQVINHFITKFKSLIGKKSGIFHFNIKIHLSGFTFLDGISWDAVAEHHDFEDLDDCTTRETDNQLCVAKHNCDCVPKYGNFKYMEGLALGTDYEIRETPDRGKGVFTLREIPANTYLMVYSGEIINGVRK